MARRPFSFSLGVWLFISAFTRCANLHAAILSICDEASLTAALHDGGVVTFGCSGTILLSSTLVVAKNAVLDASGQSVIISGNGLVRVFQVNTGVSLTLVNITVADGRSTNGAGLFNDGGAVLIRGSLFTNNVAHGRDGVDGANGTNGFSTSPASDGERGTSGDSAKGGAVFNTGTLIVTNSIFAENLALGGRAGGGGHGGNGGDTTNFCCGGRTGHGGNGGDGGNALGGAIYNLERLTIDGSTFHGNEVRAGHGGTAGDAGLNNFWSTRGDPGLAGAGGHAIGGAVYNERMFSGVACFFAANSAVGGSGSNGATGYNGSGSSLGGPGTAGGEAGWASAGAVCNLGTTFIAQCVFETNGARGGAGGKGGMGGQAASDRYTMGQSAGGSGGAAAPGADASGGAIFSTSHLVLSASVFSRNEAVAGSGGTGGSGGPGGDYATGFISGDGATGGGGATARGGAVVNLLSAGQISNVVFSGNVAFGGAGGMGGAAGLASSRWSTGAAGGAGGPGGDAFGGAFLAESGRADFLQAGFTNNVAVGGNAGAGNAGANVSSGYVTSGPGGGGGGGGTGGHACGGGTWLAAPATFADCRFIGNVASSGRGGNGGNGGNSRSNPGGGASGGEPGTARGGALFSTNVLLVESNLFQSNEVVGARAGDGGSAGTFSSTLFTPSNGANGAPGTLVSGGAIQVIGIDVAIHATIFADNAARAGRGGDGGTNSQFGGYYGSSGLGGLGGMARGGAVDVESGSFSAFVCSFQRNRAAGGRGGNGGPGGTSIHYDHGIAGTRGGDGGAAFGGAVAAQNSSGHVSSSTFADNSAAGGSGGAGGPNGPVLPASGGDGATGAEARGGAIFFAGATLQCTNSTLFQNTVISGSGGAGGAGHIAYSTQTGNGGASGNSFGGALWSENGNSFGLNLTFSDNATLAGSGGTAGIVGNTNSTPGTNGATGIAAGGAVGVNTNGILSLQNTILANSLSGGNCSGPIVDAGHNVSSDSTYASPSGTSFSNTDPLLGALQDNGGPTFTMALQAGSPAIDAGDDSACPRTDQRGIARPGGEACDIGAYEAVAVFTIAGRVTAGMNGADAITVAVGALRIRTDALGNYRVAGLPPGQYVVKPLPANGAFEPSQRVVTVGPNAAAIDFSLNRANISAFSYASSGMWLRFVGPDEQIPVVEVSSNLVDWVRLPVSMEASSGHLQFLDTNSSLHHIRFYRIASE